VQFDFKNDERLGMKIDIERRYEKERYKEERKQIK